MASLCRVATCNLNQWAMDFEGNLRRIEASIGPRRHVHPAMAMSCMPTTPMQPSAQLAACWHCAAPSQT
jgi:hypothetical protein